MLSSYVSVLLHVQIVRHFPHLCELFRVKNNDHSNRSTRTWRGGASPVVGGRQVGMGSINSFNSFNSFETLRRRETLLRHGRRVDTRGTFYPE